MGLLQFPTLSLHSVHAYVTYMYMYMYVMVAGLVCMYMYMCVMTKQPRPANTSRVFLPFICYYWCSKHTLKHQYTILLRHNKEFSFNNTIYTTYMYVCMLTRNTCQNRTRNRCTQCICTYTCAHVIHCTLHQKN